MLFQNYSFAFQNLNLIGATAIEDKLQDVSMANQILVCGVRRKVPLWVIISIVRKNLIADCSSTQ